MRTFDGIVVSKGMSKTVVVEVTRRTPHPLYKKLIKRSNKLKADNTGFEQVELGNTVRIVETRPISKQKYFKISKILSGEAKPVKKDETAVVSEEKPEVKEVIKVLKEAKKSNTGVKPSVAKAIVGKKETK